MNSWGDLKFDTSISGKYASLIRWQVLQKLWVGILHKKPEGLQDSFRKGVKGRDP